MCTGRSPRLEELLEELLDLFLVEGFRRFTLEDLCTRLHCSKSTLYELGASKEQLIVNVVRRFFRAAISDVEAATARSQGPEGRIVAYLRAVASALGRASPMFIADLAAHPAAGAVYRQNTVAAAGRVRDLVDEGIASGAFRDVSGEFVADLVTAEMRRIQTGEVRRITDIEDAVAYEQLAVLVLNGIRAV